MAQSEGGCSKSCANNAALAGVSADLPACCQKEDSACEHEGSCPLTTLAATSSESLEDQPFDDEALAKLPVGEDLAPLPVGEDLDPIVIE